MSEKLIAILASVFISIAVIALIALMAWSQSNMQEEATRKHCSQYDNVPEKYIDRVPPACTGQYFDRNGVK